MTFFAGLLNSMPGAISQGLIWGIMAIGVYITYKILDFPDLTVDGSLCTGAAVCVLLTLNGTPMWLAMLCAVIAGLLAGLITGLFHTVCGIPDILAGILTQLALYSINLRIMGWGTDNGSKANLPISVDKYDLLVSARHVQAAALHNPMLVLTVFVVLLIALLYWFFGRELGSALRATGANGNMARAQGINTNFTKVLGLMISNGLVALAGALLAQYQGFSDINMGRGAIVVGLQDFPEFRPETPLCGNRRHHLLCGHPDCPAPGHVHGRFEAAYRPGGGPVPGNPILEEQIGPAACSCGCTGEKGGGRRCLN